MSVVATLWLACAVASVLGQGTEGNTGCCVRDNSCVCTQEDCASNQSYDNLFLCQEALEKRVDSCRPNPCGQGFCAQTNSSPGYKCFCYGTRRYGDRCQHECTPRRQRRNDVDSSFPLACILG